MSCQCPSRHTSTHRIKIMSNDEFEARTQKARAIAVKEHIARMYQWYLANNFQVPPEEFVEDRLTYRGKVLRWFDPPLRREGNPDPVLIEEYLGGDTWSLRFEERNR